MINYSYRCKCGYEQDEFKKMVDHAKGPIHCGEVMSQVLSPFSVRVFTPYNTAAVDKESSKCMKIINQNEHNAFLRRNELEEVGDDKSMAPPPVEEIKEKQNRERKELANYNATYDLADL